MLVTIVADASVDPEHQVGGFGFWIVSERGRHAGGGPFKCAVGSSQVAEMMAVVNAISTALTKTIGFPGDLFLVQTDSLCAIARLTRRPMHRDPSREVAQIIQVYEQLLAENHIAVEFRHVKAHTNNKDKRSLAQRHSDLRARTAMRQARANKLRESQCPGS